ncbi:sulfotransferase family protein [Paracoccus jeotgali]|uniref:sulfotransferase family protein n=1 Tax=Paracoccus jeotgali TaxID=2065379 RepID=UPI0028AAE70E|nr:sulfotransferase [Paracoccus jeotgali]
MPADGGARAIFVLGLQRSGTTWVANMLHGSGSVAAVAAEDHRGVHESLYFSHFSRIFAPLSVPQVRAAFRMAFAASDYWLLSGLPDATLDAILSTARDHGDVFEAIMDAVADLQGAPHWLEKSPHHTLLARQLATRFPAARFVCVTRDSRTLIASRLSAYGRTAPTGVRRLADILRGALANALHTRYLRRFARDTPLAYLVHYDTLVADQDAGRDGIVRALGLAVPPGALVSRFAPNTSHDPSRATRHLSRLDRAALGIGNMLGRVLPLSLLGRLERRRRVARGADWPDWVWKRSGFRP